MTDTSQYGEATAIVEHFAGRKGRFLDVGAYNGQHLSNTRPLYELGWDGVFVEPSPLPFGGLIREYGGNERITLVNAAITTGPARLMPFYSTGDALSTSDPRHHDRFSKAGFPFTRILIPGGIGWDELLVAVSGLVFDKFDFVNIDVEGSNADVLRAMPIRPEMVCVEYDQESDGINTIQNILTSFGYRWKVYGINVLGVRQC